MKDSPTNKGQSTVDSDTQSYTSQVSRNVEVEVDMMKQSVQAVVDTQAAMLKNTKSSQTTKDVAISLAAAEAGIAAIGNVMGLGIKVSESLLLPIMQKLSFLKGIASLPVLKQTDPVLGIDVHNVIIPPSPVVPMPHPYIGMLLRPKDFVSCAMLSVLPAPAEPNSVDEGSADAEVAQANTDKALNLVHTGATMAIGMLGASVKLGDFLPRAVAGTITKSIPHIPMGTGFSPPFMTIQKNVGHSFLGSLFVNADNDPLSGAVAHLHNDCWDVGAINVHNEDGVPAAVRFYAPSGVQTAIPMGRPVIVNPIPIPINPLSIGNKLFKAGLGKLTEKFRKNFQKVLDKIAANPKLKKAMGGCPGLTNLSKMFGTGVSHPADVAAGHFYTDNTDFSLPGIVSVDFERNYYSYSDYNGPLGTGWHHSYDMALAFDKDDNIAALRLQDGRTTGFEIPARGKSFFNRREKLWLHQGEDGEFSVLDLQGLIYCFTKKTYCNPFNKTDAHLLQSISNRNGYALRLSYDYDGILEKITDTAGREIIFHNDGRGHISDIQIPSPNNRDEKITVSSYQYDAENRLISQTDALGQAMHFEYDGTLMTKETWRGGLAWHIRYKGTGKDAKCIEITGDNNLMHYRLNYVSDDCTVVTDSLGHITTYYHLRGFVTKRIDPNGGEYIFRYNTDNELEWTIDPIGNGEGETHDECGNLATKTAADGGFTHLKYEHPDFVYLPTSAIDATGGRWAWEYDDQGNLVRRVDPVGAVTCFVYTDGLLTTITGAEEQQTQLHYDNQGNLVQATAPDGGINRWRYDLLGQCLKHENAKGGAVEYEYDLLGQVTKVKEADGNIRQLSYDKEGNVIHAKDSDRDVRFTYRGVNKLASRSERGATLRFRYDTEDQLRIVENENGEEYLFNLDAQGDVIEETGFDGLTRTYERDLSGQVIKVIRPSGQEIAYEYDPVGRVTKILYAPDGKKPEEESYEYRRDGALVKAVNKYAEIVLERDVMGRVVKETCNGTEINSQYDLSGNRTQITSNLGADIHADYNLMGDVVSLANGGWQTQYQRDLFGLETGRNLSGGVHTITERDRLGRVTGHKIEKNNRKITEKNYLWGTNDKLLGIVSDGKAKHFEYDGCGNLSKTLFADGNVELRHPDKTGNLFESLDRLDRKYARGGQLIKTDRWEYKYDAEGNLVRKKGNDGQVWRYEWNEAGMLAKVKRPDAHEITFQYDALGRRIEKRHNRNVTHWVWDGNVPLHEQKETHIQDYDQERGYFTNVEKQPVVTWVFEEGTFVPTAKLTEKQQLSIVTNYLGTPEAMYREDGEAVWKCELNSYGKVRNFQGQYKTECPFRYQGQYEDSETGLYYNRFRYYSPEEGVYLSQDPIGLAGGMIFYGYVQDLNTFIDPLGLTAELYKLVATQDGYYDLKQYGKQTVKNGVYLKKGETYKIGETTQFNKVGKQKRYSEVSLQKNNLEYVRLQHSPNKSAKKSFQKLEIAKIDKHTKRFEKKPGGNSCRH